MQLHNNYKIYLHAYKFWILAHSYFSKNSNPTWAGWGNFLPKVLFLKWGKLEVNKNQRSWATPFFAIIPAEHTLSPGNYISIWGRDKVKWNSLVPSSTAASPRAAAHCLLGYRAVTRQRQATCSSHLQFTAFCLYRVKSKEGYALTSETKCTAVPDLCRQEGRSQTFKLGKLLFCTKFASLLIPSQ